MNRLLFILWFMVIYLSIDTGIEYGINGCIFLGGLFIFEILLGIVLREMERE